MIIALPYFTEPHWQQLSRIAEAGIEQDYAAYLDDLQATESAITAQGYRSKRIEIDTDRLFNWGAATGHKIDHDGRALYAGELLKQMHEGATQ
jgi:hypothetical protein